MAEVKALFDTNILIDYLNGIAEAREEIQKYKSSFISIITRMEVLIGAKDEEEEKIIKQFLSHFVTVPLTEEIAEEAIRVRKKERLKLPDAIIRATASVQEALLVTRNTKDFGFSEEDPSVRIPYNLEPNRSIAKKTRKKQM